MRKYEEATSYNNYRERKLKQKHCIANRLLR